MRILLDMDGVLADFERKVIDLYRERYPHKPIIPNEQRTTFYIKDQYPSEERPLLEEIYNSPGFFRSLPPLDGAIDAVRALERRYELFICTSPLGSSPSCITEKLEWVEYYLGKSVVGRTVIAKDKTVVIGDILIDDRPEVKGIQQPVWEHVLYTQPYNRMVSEKRRLTWGNWKDILEKPIS